jgi:multiple antibiotic resistance protein
MKSLAIALDRGQSQNRLRRLPMLGVSLALASGLAFGQESVPTAKDQGGVALSLGQMFTFFFLMLGPLKILGPFVQITRKADAALTRRIAIRAFVYSCAALVLAGVIGEESLRKFNIRVSVLAITAGIILFLVALRAVLEQFNIEPDATPKQYEPDMRYAASPLAFPTIVTPYGVATVIVFMALTPDYMTEIEIYCALLGLMVLNLVAMLFARPILKYLQMPLMLFGTILGIIQVALGLSITLRGLQDLALVLAK